MKPSQHWLAAAALAAVSLQSACSRGEGTLQAKTDSSAASLALVPVAQVTRTRMATRTTLTAEFQPFQEVDVMAKVAGYLRSIKVDLGDHVREGQILAELEIPEMTDEVSRAAAVVEQVDAEIGAARDELQRAESAHEISHLSFVRLQDVARREPGLIPQQEIDESRSRDMVTEAQVASAKSRLRVAQQKTRVAKAEESRFKTMRNYMTITAPFSGTVTKRYANVGSMIQAGIASQSQAMPLVRLSQISTLRLSLPVPESIVPRIRNGQPVEVRVRSLDRVFSGRVTRFAARLDATTRTMITEVDVPNPDGAMMPGMYAEVSLESTAPKETLAVPLEAVEHSSSGTRVYAVNPAGEIRVVAVELGTQDSGRAEVLSGLQQDDVVITGRRAGLNAGDRVRTKLVTPEH